VLRSEHDPDGMHSWLEINGWVIDAANGADRPVIITSTNAYYRVMQVTNATAGGMMMGVRRGNSRI
jgi:hypothetical protein